MPANQAHADGYTIGTLAQAAGVNVETVRFYQRKGLMPEPTRHQGRVRRYTSDDLGQLRFIKAAQRLGFSLDEVGELLRLNAGVSCSEARRIGEMKLNAVRRRIEDLRGIEQALSTLIARCDKDDGPISCPLIRSLQQDSHVGKAA